MKSLIPEIIEIFEKTPKIQKNYVCHGELHFSSSFDILLIKHKLRELFKERKV